VKIHPKKHIDAHKPFTGLVLVKTLALGFLPYTLKMKIYLNSYPVLKTRLWVERITRATEVKKIQMARSKRLVAVGRGW
jgi:hypothetical protein